MSNIDERVVKMEFDNKAFEQHASETMSTLDKLKNALKFDNIKNSFGKITQAAEKVDVSSMADGVDAVNAKFSAMQVVGYSAINNLTNSLMNFGKRVVGGTFGQIVQGGINRAFNIEQAKFTIEGLGKDFVQLKEDINYAVSGTAYGFDEAAKAASMMAASGIEAGDQMKASLRGISGMAAMTGDSYSNIADIFGNIAGKGKLGLQEVNRFATRGINVAAKLAEQMHESEETVRDMISKGKISFQEFAAAMDDAFGEHATEANKTFTGAMSNIKASLSRIGEAFIHPLIETNEKDALLLQTYKKMNPELVKIAQNSNKAFENGVNARTALNNTIKDSKNLLGITNKEIKWAIDGNEKAYINSLKKQKDYTGFTTKQLKQVYESDQKEIFKVLSKTPEYANKTREELQAILATGKEQFVEQARQMDQYSDLSDKQLGKLYEKYSGIQYNIVTVLQAFKRMLGVIEGAIGGSKFVEVFLSKMEKASEALSLFFNAVAATFSTVEKNGKTIQQALSIAVGDGTKVIKASKLWTSFRKVLGLTKTDFDNLRDTLKGFWSIFQFIADAVSSIFKVVSTGTGVFKPILSIILSITGTLGRLTSGILSTIKSFNIFGNIAKVISGVLGGIIKAITAIINVVVDIFTRITNNPLFYKIISIFKAIGKTFDDLFGRLFAIGKAIVNTFLNPFLHVAKEATFVADVVDFALGKIADALDYFLGGLKKASKGIVEFVESFVDIGGIYKTAVKFANFFKKGFNLEGIFDGIFGIFSGNNAKKASALNPAGMFSSLTNGIKTLFDSLSKFDFSKVAKALQDGLLTVAGLLLMGFEKIGQLVSLIDFKKIADFLQTGLLTIIGVVIITAEKIKEGLDMLIKAVSSIDFVALAKSISGALESFIKLLVSAFMAIPSILGKVFSNLANNISNTINADNIGIGIGKALTAGIRLIFKVIPVILTIIVRALQEVLTNLPGILHEFGYALNKTFGDDLGAVFTRLKKMLSKMSFLDILKAIDLIALYQFIKEATKTLKAMGLIINPLEEVQKFLGSVRDVLNTSRKVLNAVYIKLMIVNLLLLLAGLVAISFIPFERIINGLYKMAIIAGALLLFMKGLGKVTKIDSPNTSKTVASITGFVAVMILLSGALALLSNVKNLGNGLAGFGAILLGIVGFMFAISKIKIRPANFKKIAQSMVILSGAIAIMAVGLGILSMLNPVGLLQAVLAVGVIIATLTIASQNVGRNAKSLAAMGPLLLSIAGSLALLSLFDFKTLGVSVLAIVGVIAALVGASFAIQKAKLGMALDKLSTAIAAFGLAVLAVGGGVYLFVAALHTLSMMGQDGGLEALRLTLSTLASMIPEIIGKLGEGLVLAAQAIGNSANIIINAVLDVIQSLLMAMLERAYTFATVGVQIVLTVLEGLLSVMDQLVIAGVQICVKFLDGVSSNMDSIVNSGILLGVSFINGVSNGLNNHSDEIWAAVKHLCGAIVNFFIEGLATVLDSVDTFGLGLGDEVRKAKDTVDNIFGDGTVSKNVEKEMGKASDSVNKNSKKAKNSAKKEFGEVPKAVSKSAKDSKNAAKKYSSIEDVMKKSMKGTIKAADLSKDKDFIKNAENAGKSYKTKLEKTDTKKSGKKLGSDAANGAGSQEIYNLMKNGGEFSGKGYVNGVLSMVSEADKAGYKLGKASKTGQKRATGESSPAKEFIKGGKFAGEGFIIGMRRMISSVYNTGYALGDSSVTALKESFKRLNANIGDIDSTPTIRPVLDLSNVKMGLNSIDSMFNENQYALRVAGSLASGGVRNTRSMRPMTVNANITVSDVNDGRQFADDFMQELEVYARTNNG